MRLLVTADLHVNHAAGRDVALKAIEQINQTPADVLLLVGDTSVADGDSLEAALSAITFDGPKLFVAGNHELWTNGQDSHDLFARTLPARVAALGWQWLETEPFVQDGVAIVGSIGWYDYSYAPASFGIPKRFYEAKVSPGGAARLSEFESLLGDDVPPSAMEIVARWNDGRHIKLHMSDEAFLDECLSQLQKNLTDVTADRIVAGVHHVPFEELLPPRQTGAWDFVRAYLGSARLGELLSTDPRVTHVLCGHSHSEADVRIGNIRAINIGSTYRKKRVMTIDV